MWLGTKISDANSPNMLVLMAMMMNPKDSDSREDLLQVYMTYARTHLNTMHSILLLMPLTPTPNLLSVDWYGGNIDVYTWFQHQQKNPCIREIYVTNHIDAWNISGRSFIYNNNIFPTKVLHLDGCNFLIGIR